MMHAPDGSPVTLGWLYDDEEPMPERPIETVAEDDRPTPAEFCANDMESDSTGVKAA